MTWTFKITTGQLFSPDGNLISTGYTGGNCGKNPEGVDNPADEGMKNIGPLPEGIYIFGTPVEHSQLGAFAIPLIPYPSNDMKGRGGFFMHGDVAGEFQSASEGCIIMPPNARHSCANSEDQTLTVIA